MAAPSIDARLVPVLGLRRDVKRMPSFGLGCVAGAAGLARVARLPARASRRDRRAGVGRAVLADPAARRRLGRATSWRAGCSATARPRSSSPARDARPSSGCPAPRSSARAQRALPRQRERHRLGHRRHRIPHRADRRGLRHDRREHRRRRARAARRPRAGIRTTSAPGSRIRAARGCSRRSSAACTSSAPTSSRQLALARRGRQPVVVVGAARARRHARRSRPARTGCCSRSARGSRASTCCCDGRRDRCWCCSRCSILLTGVRAHRRAGRSRRATRRGRSRAAASSRAAGTSRRWSRCTPGCCSARSPRCGCSAGRSCPGSAGRCSSIALLCQAGRLLDHRLARAPVEHPRHRGARHAAGARAGRTAGRGCRIRTT